MSNDRVSLPITRRMMGGFARIGIPLQMLLQRARNAILRPISHELVAEAGGCRIDNETLRADFSAALVRTEATLHRINGQFDARVAEIAARLETERSERRLQVATLESLITEASTLRLPTVEQPINHTPSPIVSVILPTRDRANFISDAIASVKAQRFTDWELIIVDDGSRDDTAATVARYLADTRIQYVQQWAAGAGQARNRGLKLARGALIAYLDSDNVWYPDFLTTAINMFACDPAVDLVYGVLVTDAHGLDGTRWLWVPFNRDKLLESNYIDMNVVVHRKNLIARYGGFDESLRRCLDWDLVLRYTEHAPARELPVLAARYRICDDIRITHTRPYGRELVAIKRKWYPLAGTKRRPRVLYALWRYPHMETDIDTEIRCMLRWGVHIEIWCKTPPAFRSPVVVPVHDGSLADAVGRVQPDVIHTHSFDFAGSEKCMLNELGPPVTIRAPGDELTLNGLHPLLDRPWIRAIYIFPHQLPVTGQTDPRVRLVRGAFDATAFPPAQKDRRLVISVGAMLPCNDISFFFEVAKRLPDHQFVFAGITCAGMEGYRNQLGDIHARVNCPVEMMFDLQREDLNTLIARASIYLHTGRPPETEAPPIRIPVFIAEALATGAHILVRDIPELRELVGNAGTTYRDVEHATKIITTITAWSEKAWMESTIAAVDRAFINHADELVLRPIFEDWCAMISRPQA